MVNTVRQAGVLDVGCHSALLTVARRRAGVAMEEVLSRKVRLQLHETLDATGRLDKSGVRSVQRAVAETLAENREALPEVYAFATSVIRDAPNRDEVLAQVASATGTRLRVLSGEEEARLAYVAARHWAGERPGSLLVLDIGGGTVEVASGTSRQPRTAHSLPLGARTVTRTWKLDEAVSSKRRLAEVRDHLSDRLADADLPHADPDGRVLACSKTFTQLARYTTAGSDRSRAPQRLTLDEVRAAVGVLAKNGSAGRGRLPGISRHRAGQSLAGALVAEALMEACRATSVEISPWSTREGLLLERLGALRTKNSTRR
ncbi:Ppx/GppA phosphatase family protein [Streptomyces sp. NPDC059445]|uniref:Ppx/GppA phosphatase family protein n=1 Tax=unclassified Streptomyces TaxID=2593676 RepID=UPI0036901F97